VSHVPVEPFESRYRADPDPWRFATSDYEQRRYDLAIAALPRPRYRRAFEPGCAIGELTRRLAERCDEVVAIDASPTVVAEARHRCAGHANVAVRVGELPDDWPQGRFDLVVLSEIGYYFTIPALTSLRDRAVAALEPNGTLLAVHWRGHSPDHLLHGDEVHRCFAAAKALRPVGRYEEAAFVLDVWTRS
jgi:SAM-dependent methyltransferase